MSHEKNPDDLIVNIYLKRRDQFTLPMYDGRILKCTLAEITSQEEVHLIITTHKQESV